MQTLWFTFSALVFAMYVVLDGFDFGAGIVHLFVARPGSERRQVLGAIGPFWDGNEVWLVAGGGVLFLAFPKVLASALSGFYLAIMMVLWVLILRGIAMAFRSHLDDVMWRQFWDGVFVFASTLAPLVFGAALGNLIRGVPLQPDGWFTLPLFDSFSPRGALGILDWYTMLAALLALAAVAHHGTLFLAWKTDGPVRERSVAAASRLWPAVVALWIVATAATAWIAPGIFVALSTRAVAWLATALLIAGLGVSRTARRAGRDRLAFLASAAFLLGTLGATAACVFPVMIRSATDPILSLTALNSSSAAGSLAAGLWWWPVGFVLAVGYLALLFRMHRARVQATDGHGY
jgi:cytochrome d ubiquinol oxidase subunit II